MDKLHVELITDIIDLFVDLGKMVVSLLTGTSNSVLDTARKHNNFTKVGVTGAEGLSEIKIS